MTPMSVCFLCARCKETANAENVLTYCPKSKTDKPHSWIACQYNGEVGGSVSEKWIFEPRSESEVIFGIESR